MRKNRLKKRHHTFQEIKKITELCTKHAQSLLDSSKILFEKDKINIAFHLSVLALEEIGKATMTVMGLTFPGRESESTILERNYDIHIKKILWALWMPSMKMTDFQPKKIRVFRELAIKIHNDRLSCLYVDTDKIRSPQQMIKKRDVKKMMDLVKTRINLAMIEKLHKLNTREKGDLQWFIEACEDSDKRKLVLGRKSLKKLEELNEDVKKWIMWMRKQFEAANKESLELLKSELARKSIDDMEAYEPKWRYKIRLMTSSHSIHRRVLAWWNTNIERIKLFYSKKNEFLVEFTLPKKVLLNDFWDIGLFQANAFVLSLNLATQGFFYFSISNRVLRFYEKLTDIETGCEVRVDKKNKKLNWGNNILSENDLKRTAFVFSFVNRLIIDKDIFKQAFGHYSSGLMYMSKNDIFRHFELHIFVNFLKFLQICTFAFGDWNKKENFVNAFERVLVKLNVSLEDYNSTMQIILNLNKKKSPVKVNLENGAVLKVLCDAYFFSEYSKKNREQQQRDQLYTCLVNTLSARIKANNSDNN